MGEFVAAFPIHPDCIELLTRIPIVEKRGILNLLSEAVEQILDEPVPENRAGLISGDDFWMTLARDATCLSVPEVEVVANAVQTLERSIDKNFARADSKTTALRLLRTLALHRLTAGDVYNNQKRGVTAARLCDTLALPPLELEHAGDDPATDPPARVVNVLRQIQAVDHDHCLSFDPESDRWHLQPVKFKRFVRPEVMLHWVNAVPFLMLMVTGGITMASRFWPVNAGLLGLLRITHLTFAAFWLIGMPLVVMLGFRIHWQNIQTMLGWTKADVIWLVQSVRSLLSRKSSMSPVGRFNAGQKINSCLVMAYFTGFGITGILMFFKESILFPWYVHAALFFATMASVGGHLYLSFINPSTRKSLPGIFSGWAPVDYIEHHHPLSLPPSLRTHIEAPTARTVWEEVALARTEFLTLIAVFIMAGVGVLAFQQGQIAGIKKSFAKSFTDSITPNQLSTKHRIGPTAESCVKCHSYTGQIPDVNCEQCHLDIRKRRTLALGYHGTLKGNCKDCHREHPTVATNSVIPLQADKFDHNLAAYKLLGKHAKVACDDCHKKNRPPKIEGVTEGVYYIGLNYAVCTDCHKDVHDGKLVAACEKCHTEDGWTGKNLKFNHDTDSTYPLTGKHKIVECIKCHQPKIAGAALGTAPFKGISSECISCHKDLHRGELATQCTPCHSTAGWVKENLTFDHTKNSKYPLEGKHDKVACEKCHLPSTPGEKLGLSKFRGLKMECLDCHKDPHKGEFVAACITCHPTPATWVVDKKQFDHNRDSKFPLEGEHAGKGKCIKCHKPEIPKGPLGTARFKGVPTACQDCHKIKHPEKHPETFGPLCVSCHNTRHWGKKPPELTHIQNYSPQGEKLLGKHLLVECRACHNESMIPRLGIKCATDQQCSICHQTADPHKGTLGLDCFRCHNTLGWKGSDLRFDHNTMTRYQLDQDHENVACVKCHENNHWKPVETICKSCHPGKF